MCFNPKITSFSWRVRDSKDQIVWCTQLTDGETETLAGSRLCSQNPTTLRLDNAPVRCVSTNRSQAASHTRLWVHWYQGVTAFISAAPASPRVLEGWAQAVCTLALLPTTTTGARWTTLIWVRGPLLVGRESFQGKSRKIQSSIFLRVWLNWIPCLSFFQYAWCNKLGLGLLRKSHAYIPLLLIRSLAGP